MHSNKLRTATLGIALAALIGAGVTGDAFAQACEYPLFIQQAAVDANVLLLIDNSGSMNHAIWHDAYDENVDYSGKFNRTRTYYVSSDGWREPRDFNSNWQSSPSAYLVNSDGGERGRYYGNYLNWVYYHATAAQRANIPQVTRIQVAKPALNQIIDENPKIRFGAWQYNFEDGGDMIAAVGSPHDDIKTAINNMRANTWTPIGESMSSIWKDVTGNAGGTDAIEYDCQKTFLVIMTDGQPTRDDNYYEGPNPGDADGDGYYVDDMAYYLRTHDADGGLAGEQNIYTYTIGFNVDANVLQDAADQGDGLYINANNPSELTTSLSRVLRDIVNRISAGSAVAVVSTEGHSQDLLYRGKFMPGSWQGFLEAFELPYEPGEAPFWEAGAILAGRDPYSRRLITSIADVQYDFDSGNATTLRPHLGVATDAEAADLINWMHGDDNIAGLRDREGWKLGDVIASSPLVVGRPNNFTLQNDYLSFRAAHENRTRVVYIGSNDGMVHCFRETDGQELWAYIPESVLSRVGDLADPTYCHQFFCNLTPMVQDLYMGGQWRTILIAGMKQGGQAYFAIDVTIPESPQVMWEEDMPAGFETWAQPEVARLEGAFNENPVLLVGSGPSDVLFGEAYLLAHDLTNGMLVAVWSLSSNGATEINMATAVKALDLDFDGYDDVAYLGDLEGNYWRFEANPSALYGMDGAVLFQTDPGQPIQAHPVLTVDYNGDVMSYFGTGRYIEAADIPDASQQTFYSIIDKHDGSLISRAQLEDQTNTINQVDENSRGWFVDLNQAVGERVVEPDALVAGVVYFTTFAPVDEACSAGGFSWLYSVDFRDGSAEDGDEDTEDGTDGRVEEIGEGIGTKPVVDYHNDEVIVQGSDTRVHVKDAKKAIELLSVKSWRQRYN